MTYARPPSLYVIDELLKEGASVSVFDPEAMRNVKALLGDKITYGEDQYDIFKECRCTADRYRMVGFQNARF